MRQRDVIRLLDADPDLGEGLGPDEFALALRALPVRVVRVPSGAWDGQPAWAETRTLMGLLIIEGVLMRDVDLGRRSTTELMGPGDVLRPWQSDTTLDALPLAVRWNVVEELALAVLDRRFVTAAARHPAVLEAIVARTMRRSRLLALRLVVNQLVRLEDRLMISFWGLAERFGRVTIDGVILPLELTHSTLARLVGARRPSVTSALGVLAREGYVERTEHGWLLHGSPSDVLEPLGERLTAPA